MKPLPRDSGSFAEPNAVETTLRHHEVQFADAEDLAGLGRWQWQKGSRLVACSTGLLRLMGEAGETRCVAARSLWRRIRPDDRAAVLAWLRDVLTDGTAGQLHLQVSTVAGSWRHLVLSGRAASGGTILGLCQDITELHRARTELEHQQHRWEIALESAGQGVWESDVETGEVHHSPTWRRLRGMEPDYDPRDSHEAWQARLHPDDVARVAELVRSQEAGVVGRMSFEYRERHVSGDYIWISSFGAPVEWYPDGRARRVIGTDTDITERKHAEERMAQLSRRLELALKVSRVGVFEVDLTSGRIFWDDRVREMYGRARDGSEIGPTDWDDMLHPDDAEMAQKSVQHAVEHQTGYETQFRVIRPDGEIRTIRTQGTFYRDTLGAPKVLGANWDVTEEVAAKAELEHARDLAEARNAELEKAKAHIEYTALHDALTGLPNRRFLDQALEECASWCATTGGSVGLLHIDLDRFKQINDTLGHSAGDAMLIHAARLLRRNLLDGDFVARVGGDEFIIVCPCPDDTERLGRLAAAIIEQMSRPVPYHSHSCRFGASIGIAVHKGAGVDPKQLLINADIALYRAKDRGRNGYEFFTAALQAEAVHTKQVADDILRGIEQDEFIPYYQPLVDARTHEVVGVETLVRWRHPNQGVLGPAAFLRIAEDLNVVNTLDRIILSKALVDFDALDELGLAVPAISVNVSFRRLHDEHLIASLRDLAIRPGSLSFELVESIFLDEPDGLLEWNLDHIRELGIGIEIDDFGTGHASILGLMRLRPQRFKIDRQFLDAITSSRPQRQLVRSLVDIGKSFDIKVVAEGVESMAQADVLRDLGCDILQGFAFARPMPLDKLADFLRARRQRAVC